MLKKILFGLLAASFALSACNLPQSAANPTPTVLSADAVFTAAAQTVEAQLTQAAPSATLPVTAASEPTATLAAPLPPTVDPGVLPTLAPAPTLPPAATSASACDKGEFEADVTITDGTEIKAGQAFTKTWRIKNSGTCAWTTSYQVVFVSGTQMGAPAAVSLPSGVNPGASVDISINMVAPSAPNTYTGNWKLRNASGQDVLGMYVMIKVPGETGGGNSGGFAVTHVEVVGSGSCGSFTITATITVSGPGEVTYKWARSDRANDTVAHPALVFTGAGTQSVTTTWAMSAPATSVWMDIYIDKPNHQAFGRATLTCP